MAIIASTLQRIKSDPLGSLGGAERINRCFAQVGHVWRNRLLNPANTMTLFLLQVLHGNTAMTHLRWLWGIGCSEGSYCDARQRLPAAGVARLVEQLSCDACNQSASIWLGRRVLMIDGTTVSTPDEPALQKMWPQPSEQKSGCGFPMIKMLALMDLASGMILQLSMMALTMGEASQLAGPHGLLQAGDVLLGDRGFCSFWASGDAGENVGRCGVPHECEPGRRLHARPGGAGKIEEKRSIQKITPQLPFCEEPWQAGSDCSVD